MTAPSPAVGDIWLWWGNTYFVLISQREPRRGEFTAFNLTNREMALIRIDETFLHLRNREMALIRIDETVIHRWEKMA